MNKLVNPNMQTFLPYANFTLSAQVLDDKRLGQQRVDNMQILNTLAGFGTYGGWSSHPAVHMWAGYEHILMEYQKAVIYEWVEIRGYTDFCYVTTYMIYSEGTFYPNGPEPWWLGNEDYHLSHQSWLLREDPEYYGPIFPGVPDNIPIYWPTHQETPYE